MLKVDQEVGKLIRMHRAMKIYRRTVSRKISNKVADDSCLGQDA